MTRPTEPARIAVLDIGKTKLKPLVGSEDGPGAMRTFWMRLKQERGDLFSIENPVFSAIDANDGAMSVPLILIARDNVATCAPALR
jgi:hypothetical protein